MSPHRLAPLIRRLLLLALAAAPAAAHGEAGVAVSAGAFGAAWPFTLEVGTLRCEPPGAVVFRAGGVDYAVNRLADAKRYADIMPIWRRHPDGQWFSVAPLVERGLALCDR